MREGQLYAVFKEMQIAHHVVRQGKQSAVVPHVVADVPLMRWPNGRPCEPVNAYLIEQMFHTTGASTQTYAAELSHLVRFCADHMIGFEALADKHLWQWSKQLQTAEARQRPGERARNNNTVRSIIRRALAFLVWYRDRLTVPGGTPLIGAAEVSPQITVKFLMNAHRSRTTYLYHRSMPEPVSTEPKGVMPRSMIEDIEKRIEDVATLDNLKEATTRRYAGDSTLMRLELEYVCCRRRFMLWIMKRTGLRPAELAEMPLDENRDVLKSKRLVLPTKKRRRKLVRSFAITLHDATYVARYLANRQAFLDTLAQRGVDVSSATTFLLARNGGAIEKGSLEKDFERLSKAAGYCDVQSCLSMFRHRFITYEVMAHLREFMGTAGKPRQLMTDADYRSILKRVAVKTGHGSVESLWHYIDLAWDEMDVWGKVDGALERLRATDRFYEELLDLRRDVATNSVVTPAKIIDHVTTRLSEILGDARVGFAGAD